MAEVDNEYVTKMVTVVRGLEARSIKKWEDLGWQFVSRDELPMLRTQLEFRRVKPKTPCLLLSGLAAVGVVGIATLGIMNPGADPNDRAEEPAPAATVAAVGTPSVVTASVGTPSQQTAETTEDTYTYEGPDYEVVVVDSAVGPAALDQYWIYTPAIEGSAAGHRDQAKAIIQDLAHKAGSDKFIAQIVTDKEIALAESISTYEAFVKQHGDDYVVNDILEKEVTGWVAAYTGGFDSETGAASDADSAFEALWWPYGDTESEEWRPAA
ncbi:hypothetical protein [Tessaracoccus sp. ZS01]|uniref:hypothetical protein n=1 Tax=Tessaracoccus sp. ZS01 TaxID=1906324 RepID=UPI00096EAAD7|nr:hypothetical protein [Tessaracoccus sp. ZS01]MCG6567121.1 hypothetical protein [Tessaracoccus sp. ZS01]OMG57524.1 hypothetical protein BJN44_05715 [Tessaracoccus sp. ZS01]